MRQTTTYQLIQVRMGRDLAQWVEAQREDGKSWRAIAADAAAVTGVPVSHETFRAWFAEDAA
jgi:hypothetical protein